MSGIVNLVRTPEPGVAVGLAAVAVTAAGVGIGVGQVELAGHSHPDIWSSPWIVGAIFIAGVGLLGAVIVLAAGIFGPRGEDTEAHIPTPVNGALTIERKSMADHGERGDGPGPRTQTPVSEVPGIEANSIIHDRQAESGENPGIAFRQKWIKPLVFLLVLLGVAITDLAAYWDPLLILFPQAVTLFTEAALVAVTFLSLVAAGTLGVALAQRGQEMTSYASIGIASAAIAWLAPGMVMFLAELQNNDRFGFSGSDSLPRVIILGAVYLASGVYVALEVRHLLYSGGGVEKKIWSPLVLRRAYLGGFVLLIVVAVGINTIDLQAILESLLPYDTDSLALLLAAGITLLALASAFRFGIAIVSRRREGVGYRSFDLAAPAAIWLVFGVAIFLSQWLNAVGYSGLFLFPPPSLGEQILGPLAFFAIYLVSGVCVIFQARHFSEAGYPVP
jgi:hypothetical protein